MVQDFTFGRSNQCWRYLFLLAKTLAKLDPGMTLMVTPAHGETWCAWFHGEEDPQQKEQKDHQLRSFPFFRCLL